MAMNAKTIREACKYEALNNLTGTRHGAALYSFADNATDAELIRFAQLIGNVTEPAPVADWENIGSMDSAELARHNID